MLCADTMMRAVQPDLDVREHLMDDGHVHTSILARILHDGIVRELGQPGIALEAVADNGRSSLDIGTNEAAKLFSRGIRQNSDPRTTSDEALLVDAFILDSRRADLLHRTDHHRFALGLRRTSVALLLPAAIERLIDLHEIVQLEVGAVIGQGVTQLVAHEPSCVVPDGKLTADVEGRHAPLVVGDQVSGDEPLAERRAVLLNTVPAVMEC